MCMDRWMDKEIVIYIHNGIFSSVQSLSHLRLFATPWIAAHQASLSITNSQSSLRLTSIESVMPSSHLILCRPLLLLPPISPSIRVFSNESTLHMRWPKYWHFSFSIIPSNEHPGLISFRMDWLDLLAKFQHKVKKKFWRWMVISCKCTGASALASFLPKKSQGWSPSEWTGWISLQSKGLSRAFSNTTVQKHQFFGAQLSL